MNAQPQPIRLIAAAVMVLAATVASAQPVDTETFTVTVPTTISIQAPVSGVVIVHDGTPSDQPFAPQSWLATANLPAGATVVLGVSAPFTHSTLPTIQRDCQLNLTLGVSEPTANWIVTKAVDVTDIDAGFPDFDADVSASSNAPGGATLDLRVTFITDSLSTLSQGDYTTVVTGTITAN